MERSLATWDGCMGSLRTAATSKRRLAKTSGSTASGVVNGELRFMAAKSDAWVAGCKGPSVSTRVRWMSETSARVFFWRMAETAVGTSETWASTSLSRSGCMAARVPKSASRSPPSVMKRVRGAPVMHRQKSCRFVSARMPSEARPSSCLDRATERHEVIAAVRGPLAGSKRHRARVAKECSASGGEAAMCAIVSSASAGAMETMDSRIRSAASEDWGSATLDATRVTVHTAALFSVSPWSSSLIRSVMALVMASTGPCATCATCCPCWPCWPCGPCGICTESASMMLTASCVAVRMRG